MINYRDQVGPQEYDRLLSRAVARSPHLARCSDDSLVFLGIPSGHPAAKIPPPWSLDEPEGTEIPEPGYGHGI